MRIDLASLARAQGVRRKRIVLRPVVPTRAQENELLAIYSQSVNIWSELNREILKVYRERLTVDAEEDEEEEQPWWLSLDWLSILSLLALFKNRARAAVPLPEEPIPDDLLRHIESTPTLQQWYVPSGGLREWRVSIDPFTSANPVGRSTGGIVGERLIYQTEKLGRWVTKVGEWHGQKTISSVLSATGVEIRPYIRLSDVQGLLDESIRANAALISSVNADNAARVEEIVRDAFTNRRTKKWLTDQLAHALGITKRRARIIAGDQLHKLNLTLTAYRNQELGIDSYIWRTMRDDRVRKLHADREGKTFQWAQPPSDGHPGYPIACRCHADPILEL